MAFLPIPLVKMSGTGNTFVLVDATKASAWSEIEKKLKIKRRPFVKMICDRTLGVSSDGVLFLEDGNHESDYKWDFYNADGSNADMCGNAARCAALFANEYLSSSLAGTYRFMTGAGVVRAQVLGDERVRILMPVVKDYQESKELEIDGKTHTFTYINSGVPHLVMQISNYHEVAALKELASKARHHKDLDPEGANVTFYMREKADYIRAVTYERGVEDFTQACGTGAVAVAYTEYKKSNIRSMDVHMPGGILAIHIPEESDNPMMIGEAVFVMEFQYFYEVLR